MMTDLTPTTDARKKTLAERGIGAIWLAIGMSLFLSFAAMAVDIGNWYFHRTKVQTATDAAALAGAALLPADPTLARAEAEQVAEQHGYPASAIDIDIIDGSILEVTIRQSVDNFFLPAIGFGNAQNIATTAVAEYEGNVAMGSPENSVGNNPELGSSGQPDFTLGIEGPGYTKINGDRFQPHNCNSGSATVSYCDASITSGIQNLEFDENGYFFAVDVEATHGQDLVFQVFDPAYVALSSEWCWNSCSDNGNKDCYNVLPDSGERDDLEDLTDDDDYTGYDGGKIPHGWYDDQQDVSVVDVDTRYQSGRNYWCVGDRSGSGTAPDTAFIVREPDNTPWNPLDNPAITQVGCAPAMFEGYTLDHTAGSNGSSSSLPNGYELLDPTNTTFRDRGEWKVDEKDGVWTLAESWRRWATVCRIPAPFVQTGKYLIQVRTVSSVANPLAVDLTKDESGLNAFSIRAGFDQGDGTILSYGDVDVFAEGHLPISANSDTANPTFPLARVLEVGRDRTLTVELFDIGDAGSLTMTVEPPPDSNLSSFTGCSFDLDGTGTPSTASSTNCSVSATSAFNGRVMLIQVPIPANYECDETSSTGCWVELQMTGSDLHDFTTWSAYISGDPVRLIE